MGEPVAKAVRAVRSKKGAEPVLADPAAASDVVMVAASALSAQVYPDSRWEQSWCSACYCCSMSASSNVALIDHT
jgi:hypothetical protein